SFDARGKNLQQAIHWSDEAVLKSKAYFYYETNPPALRIKNIKQEDAGLYRCRVDFQKSPTRNCRIDLDVLVPPSKVTILDELGAAVMDNTVGPYRENADINLTCVSSGGIPTPKVTWWKEHALLDDSFMILPDGTVKNVLYLEKLSRSDLNAIYTCQASNGHVVPPLSTNVKLTLNLPPLFITMQGLRETLTAGIKTQASCHTAGSRPSPNIIWTKGSTTIRGSSQTTSNDGNVTVSELVFVPGPEDNEKSITCSIEYPESEGATVRLKDSHVLDMCDLIHRKCSLNTHAYIDILHVPVISLSLGAPLDSQNLMEGSDVYLECDIKANPPAKKIEWFHNNKLLQSARGVIISNQTLVLQSITRATHGEYMCKAANTLGTVNSNQLYLDIKYPPVCKLEAQIMRAAVKQTVNITCDIDANPMHNLLFRWQFNNSLESMLELPPYTNVEMNEPLIHLQDHLLSAASSSSTHEDHLHHHHRSSSSTSSTSGTSSHNMLLGPNQKLTLRRKPEPPKPDLVDGQLYMYRIDSFTNFGTITCTATNAYGQSGHCLWMAHDPILNTCTEQKVIIRNKYTGSNVSSLYPTSNSKAPDKIGCKCPNIESVRFRYSCVIIKNIFYSVFLKTDVPDPIKSCTISNVTAYTVHVSCIAGKDGGIPQQFHIDIFDEHTKKLLLSITFQGPEMLLKKLPSDTKFIIKITPFNLQGTAPTSYRVKAQTLPAPLLRTAPSKAVLVQLTPLLGALVGAAVTLFLVAVCIIIFVKFKSKVSCESKTIKHHPASTTEQDKGSAEPLSRNIGSHSSIDDKNPDVIPHENSEDDDEKQFERLVLDTDRLKFTPTPVLPPIVKTYSPTHVSPTGNGLKKFGELSLTTNPSYAIYNSPIRSAYGSTNQSSSTTTTVLPVRTTSPNIYTRLPLR
ncbi:AAEL005560-PA, partial [Aedes aegypti]